MWPTLERAQVCGQLAGDYRNAGETASGLPTSLIDLLFGGRATHAPDTLVHLSFSADQQLSIGVSALTSELSPLILTREQFTCRKDALVIRSGAHWVGGVSQLGFAIGRKSTAVELHRAGRFLIVKKKEKTRGVWIAIPVSFADETWHRFEQVSSDAPNLAP
jgi:hypothetical protein